MISNQEVFDKVVQHARQQGGKAVNEDGRVCMYRDGLGNKCFAGIFIPDEDYKPEMEGKGVGNLLGHYPGLRPLFKDVSEELMVELQSLHDNYLETPYFEERVEKIAARHQLTYKEAS